MTLGKSAESIEYASLFIFSWTNTTLEGTGYIFESASGRETEHSFRSIMDVLNHFGGKGWDLDEFPAETHKETADAITELIKVPNARPRGRGKFYLGKRRYQL